MLLFRFVLLFHRTICTCEIKHQFTKFPKTKLVEFMLRNSVINVDIILCCTEKHFLAIGYIIIVNSITIAQRELTVYLRQAILGLSVMQRLPEFGMAWQKFLLILPRIPPPPSKIEIWPGLGNLSFDYSRIPPSPTQKECVETNRCNPHGYRLVVVLSSLSRAMRTE